MSHKSRITTTVERMPDRYTMHINLNYTNTKIKLHFVDESTKKKREKNRKIHSKISGDTDIQTFPNSKPITMTEIE